MSVDKHSFQSNSVETSLEKKSCLNQCLYICAECMRCSHLKPTKKTLWIWFQPARKRNQNITVISHFNFTTVIDKPTSHLLFENVYFSFDLNAEQTHLIEQFIDVILWDWISNLFYRVWCFHKGFIESHAQEVSRLLSGWVCPRIHARVFSMLPNTVRYRTYDTVDMRLYHCEVDEFAVAFKCNCFCFNFRHPCFFLHHNFCLRFSNTIRIGDTHTIVCKPENMFH